MGSLGAVCEVSDMDDDNGVMLLGYRWEFLNVVKLFVLLWGA